MVRARRGPPRPRTGDARRPRTGKSRPERGLRKAAAKAVVKANGSRRAPRAPAIRLPAAVAKLARKDPDRRFTATHFYRLPAVCREAACRRARRCMVENAPCLERHQCWYDDDAGEIYRTFNAARLEGPE